MATDYNMSGRLFKNDKKVADNQPDYTGDMTVAGKKMRLAAWIKHGDMGTYMSLKVSEPFNKPGQAAKPGPVADMDDQDIPF
jgi:uncharacterized protein (DUF736 family)